MCCCCCLLFSMMSISLVHAIFIPRETSICFTGALQVSSHNHFFSCTSSVDRYQTRGDSNLVYYQIVLGHCAYKNDTPRRLRLVGMFWVLLAFCLLHRYTLSTPLAHLALPFPEPAVAPTNTPKITHFAFTLMMMMMMMMIYSLFLFYVLWFFVICFFPLFTLFLLLISSSSVGWYA